MSKKITTWLLIFIFMMNMPVFAALKANVIKNDRINSSQKLEYVNLNFFSQFEDDYLQEYIVKAVELNHDARIASFRTLEYRENIKIALGAQLPSLSVGVDYLGLKTPDLGSFDGKISKNSLVMPFIASWEMDLFLKNNDKRKSAKKSFEAAVEDEKAVYIALSGDVASLYFNILNLDKQIELTKNILKNQNEIYERSKKSYKQGALPLIELNKQEQSLKNAKAMNEELLKSRDVVLGQFKLLIGETPNFEINRGKLDDIELRKIPHEISGGVINERPDVISAQRQLERAGIDIRVARKEFLPKLNLTGVLAFSTMSGGFFGWENTLGVILAGATQDIFAGGRKIANLKMKKFQYDQLFEKYKQTDLNALKEVNDALLIAKHDYKIYETTFEDNEIEVKNFKITQNKNNNGAIGKIELLSQQNVLLNSDKNLANKKTENLVDFITLYKACGGKL